MTRDDVLTVRERIRVDSVKWRASRNASSYRAIRCLLWQASSYPRSTIINEADKIRCISRGVNLKRFRQLMEDITGEKLCW